MAIQAIEQWLRGNKDYATGLTLVHQFSKKSRLFLKVLDQGENPDNRMKLLTELTELNKVEEKKPEPVVVRKKILSDEEYATAPADIKKVEIQAKDLIKQTGKLHAEVGTYVKEALRLCPGNVAAQNDYLEQRHVPDKVNMILDADDEIAELYYKIDYWKEHKRLPDEVARLKMAEDPAELKDLLMNKRAQVSKEKKKCKDKEPSVKLLQLMTERDDLTRRLDELV